jgi:hypothetical protein
MSGKRQNIQLQLAFMEEYRGEAPNGLREGTETLAAKRIDESLAINEQLMEEVCERENCKQALKRVKANKGSPGVDGMTVQELPEYLKEHWPAIREQLLSGTYTPQPVKRVEIPKPDGGVRKLGIPISLPQAGHRAAAGDHRRLEGQAQADTALDFCLSLDGRNSGQQRGGGARLSRVWHQCHTGRFEGVDAARP